MTFRYWWKYVFKYRLNSWMTRHNPLMLKRTHDKLMSGQRMHLVTNHKQEVFEINRKIEALLPALVQANMERHPGSNELYLTIKVDSRLVHNLTLIGTVDQGMWEYMAEMMAYEIKRQLVTMHFSQIKVVYPERPRQPWR